MIIDINSAAEKLAKVYNFDITKFRKKLINYFMDYTVTDISEDVPIGYLTKLLSIDKTEKERNENNLKRYIYKIIVNELNC